MKVRGKTIINEQGKIIGSICGHRDLAAKDSGYWIVLDDGRTFGYAFYPAIGYKCGAYSYFADAANYVRNGGLAHDMAAQS
jgi:hypothetical protein